MLRKVFLGLALVSVFILGSVITRFSLYKTPKNQPIEPQKQQIQSTNSDKVLGNYTQVPQIYISGTDQSYSRGGLIALASTDEPAVVIGGYNISGEAEVTVYEANQSALLDYLTHDKDGKQTKKEPDTGQFRYVADVKHSVNTSTYQGSKIPMPFGETGIWYLKVKIGSANADAFI